MGLISGIREIFQTKQYESKTYKTINLGLTALTKPISFITNPVKAYERTSKQGAGILAIEGAVTATTALAPFTAGGKAVGGAIVKKILDKPIASAVTGLLGAGALAVSPTLRKTGAKAIEPATYVEMGATAGGVVEKLGTGTKPEEITEPEWYALARTLGLGAGLSILTAGGVYLGYKLVSGRLKKVEEERSNLTPELPTDATKHINDIPETTKNAIIPTNEQKPLMAETSTITTGRKRRRKGARLQQNPSVNQKVNILINNRSIGLQNKRYIKEYALA